MKVEEREKCAKTVEVVEKQGHETAPMMSAVSNAWSSSRALKASE